ncbi:MAG: XisH family protein [Cyanobacteria bacterium P01_F01_bin.150]
MPAKDIFHQAVRHALEKDGWTITDDPLLIDLSEVKVFIDLGAERLIAAERGNEEIAVEVKSFVGGSTISEFHTALGQFINYRLFLRRSNSQRLLYLAVPSETYAEFFTGEIIGQVLKENALKIIVYEPAMEVIEKWIN